MTESQQTDRYGGKETHQQQIISDQVINHTGRRTEKGGVMPTALSLLKTSRWKRCSNLRLSLLDDSSSWSQSTLAFGFCSFLPFHFTCWLFLPLSLCLPLSFLLPHFSRCCCCCCGSSSFPTECFLWFGASETLRGVCKNKRSGFPLPSFRCLRHRDCRLRHGRCVWEKKGFNEGRWHVIGVFRVHGVKRGRTKENGKRKSELAKKQSLLSEGDR